MRAAFCDEWYIAAELKRIAEPLLGVQENGFSGNLFSAEPQRLYEVSVRSLLLYGFPSPFVLPPAALKVTN